MELERRLELSKVAKVWYQEAQARLNLNAALWNVFAPCWQLSEGGNAAHNAFNTIQKEAGSTDYNKIGVQNYKDRETALDAFVKTITAPQYKQFLTLLQEGANPYVCAVALGNSPWGTNGWVLCNVLYEKGIV